MPLIQRLWGLEEEGGAGAAQTDDILTRQGQTRSPPLHVYRSTNRRKGTNLMLMAGTALMGSVISSLKDVPHSE